MKTFKDLRRYITESGITHKTARFKNGYGVDLTRGLNLYNGDATYEVEILKDGKPCSDAPIAVNANGYKTEEQVDEIMIELQLL